MFQIIYNFLESFAFIAFAAMGMSIIYGMTGITNMAQGEFLMIGAFMSTFFYHNFNMPILLSTLLATLVTMILGVVMDRLVLSKLYTRPGDSLICTYGISLALIQLGVIVMGQGAPSIPSPMGLIESTNRSYSMYKIFLIVFCFVIFALLYLVFNKTRFGLYARATMQRREIASSLGINVNRMNIMVIALATGLSGLSGALYAPTMAVTGNYGASFLTHAFVAVIIGGTNPLGGTILAAMLLAIVETILSLSINPFFGRIGMLITAIIVIRMFPGGITGLIERKVK